MKPNTRLYLSVTFVLCFHTFAFSQNESPDFVTKFEKSDALETVTYQEGIHYYRELSRHFSTIKMMEMGKTDSGKPLHLVLFSAEGDFDIQSNRTKNKTILLINNAIHPGESDGVDASMMFLRDVAQKKILATAINDVLLAIIPFYNIGGVLNRNSTTRVNQNGPREYGFRGNARNYDLNRDFIKNDTRNARSFTQIFHYLDPDLFIDTHVSNGADYQYIMTLDYPQQDKLGGGLKDFQSVQLLPFLFTYMNDHKFEMTPYVNVFGRTPDPGFQQFADWPRYSSGYAALFHTIGFMTETHMLKPYRQRVMSTYTFMQAAVTALHRFGDQLVKLRQATRLAVKNQNQFPVQWAIDTAHFEMLDFKGYEGSYIKSKITDQKRLYYDRTKPFSKKIKFYNKYRPAIVVDKPQYYVIPKGWHHVINLLQLNGVQMDTLKKDSVIQVGAYHIKDYKTSQNAYEGHYFHYDIQLESKNEEIAFKQGDYLIPVDQAVNRYIIETLEPQGVDSYFKWNFFDPILQIKEGFSAYVFEDLAEEILEEDPELAAAFTSKKRSDQKFRENRMAQLYYIYQRSKYFESAYLRYPIYRINTD
ncbi:hypothetical protein QQ020_03545 [Fulvivirgaceae bacterium BMA12]|uniref:Peptidase M14 carboxypeptidase A domain-containing protein n=1 Tax=Agaribacillus aureus TaxID=3051825 RepID=A0ABT8L037_9BACT|nr:hypothetical protein [Fulvivirgaceae bacterium BMA12]